MEGLQRSTISFRRQGSSGIVWDDRVIAELNKQANEQKEESQRDEQPKPLSETSELPKQNPSDEKDKLRPIKTVSPAVEPPSPRLSTCGCCSAFGKKPPGKKNNQRKRPPKRRSR
ncbi:BnaC05g11720D [Brassica napus]|uniref:BnaC05g11720D protein n=1 Tax=Brassica napus TaxID=3708 RepID=A0A078HSC0_BRANA|nr:BnaC05g11720D [Brassica napus]